MTHTERLTLLSITTLMGACAAPCTDDGLVQQRCPSEVDTGSTAGSDSDSANSASETRGDSSFPTAGSASADASEGNSDSVDSGSDDPSASATDSASATESESATDSTSASESESVSDSQTDGETSTGPWCVDADDDGYGDPTMCDDEPGPGAVDNGDDCDDSDPHVHPGAASNETDRTLCTDDSDGDGYGDADPGPGVDPGTDCWDANPGLNPGTTMLGTVDSLLLDEVLARVDRDDADLDLVAPFETLLATWSITTTALRADGSVYINDTYTDRMYRVEADLLCVGELTLIDVDWLAMAHDTEAICGMAFVGDGTLWAVDAESDSLLVLDPETGAAVSSSPLLVGQEPLDVGGCGVAWDCASDRLLLANGLDGIVYSVDVDSAAATAIAATGVTAPGVGLEHDVATGRALLAANGELFDVALDGSGDMSLVGELDYGLLSGPILVDDLGTFPSCDP